MQAALWPSLTSSRSLVHSKGIVVNMGPSSMKKRKSTILLLTSLLIFALASALYPLSALGLGLWAHRLLSYDPGNKRFYTNFHKRLTAKDDVLALYCESPHWPGRLGNNIMSVLSVASEARMYGMQFGVKNCDHEILNLTLLQIPESKEITKQFNRGDAFFHHFVRWSQSGSTRQRDQGKHIDAGEFIFPAITPCISRDLVRPMLAHLAEKERKYSEDALVIHIRGGDTMPGWEGEIHALYAPPPLSYYVDIINQHFGAREIVIVAEKENMYPAVDRLMKLYPSIKLQAGSLEEDISVILGARYLVGSHSTFAWSLAIGSPNIEVLYTFNNGLHILDDRIFGGTKVIQYYVEDYVKRWNASEEQVEYVLNFPRNQLKQRVYTNDYPCNAILEMFSVDIVDMPS